MRDELRERMLQLREGCEDGDRRAIRAWTLIKIEDRAPHNSACIFGLSHKGMGRSALS